MQVRGSHDGRFWFKLAAFPPAAEAPALQFEEAGMHRRLYKMPAKSLRENYGWKEIVDLVPDDNLGYRNLGIAYFGEEDYGKAETMFERSLAIKATSFTYYKVISVLDYFCFSRLLLVG